MKKKGVLLGIVAAAAVFIVTAIVLYSCSGGGGSSVTGSSGTVALYATDNTTAFQQMAPPINDTDNVSQATATISKVTVLNTGSGASCDVLTTPVAINIANLSDVLQLLDVADCPAVPYNRLHIEFNKTVELINGGAQSTCSFVSFKDDSNRPNVLNCSGSVCTLDINGAINVLVDHPNNVALDFRLKDFDIMSFGTPSCSVTLKVSPIHGEEFEHLFYPESITGLVSNLTTSTDTFDLTKHHFVFHVMYSGITSTAQTGLDDLLTRAEQDGLRTRVTVSTIDFNTKTIDASHVFVKVEGLVSALSTTNHTFTITYEMGKTINVDYTDAVVKGPLADGAFAEVELYGFSGKSSDFLAAWVEVEFECTVPDDRKREMNTED